MPDYFAKLLDWYPELRDGAEFDIAGRGVPPDEFASALQLNWSQWPGSLEILDSAGSFLSGRSANVYSQFGEDGLITHLLEVIGIKNRWCFEVGAGDGTYLSNTRIWREAGWTSLQIEADIGKFRQLLENKLPGDYCIHERIHRSYLDKALCSYNAPADLDLGIIDVDGQDWHIFDGLRQFRPRVLLVEFNLKGDDSVPPLDGEGQAGLSAIASLGRSKDYLPLVKTDVNVLFVARECL